MMDALRNNPKIRSALRTLVTFDIALIAGVLIATSAFLALKSSDAVKSAHRSEFPLLTNVGAAAGGLLLVFAMALPGALDSGMRRRLAPHQSEPGIDEALARAYVIRNILVMVVLEGGAMMNAVFYYLEARPVSLLVIGIVVIGMGLQIPSLDRLARWIEGQKRQMESLPSG